jgi:hypothetical protein
MRTPQTTRTTRSNPEAVRTCARSISHESVGSSVAALFIEETLAGLGVYATLSDLVRGAQLFESAIIQSRSRR